jgi:hypothetical protein
MPAKKKFEVGDSVVAIRNPEVAMTIIAIEDDKIKCSWITEDRITKTRTFKATDLEKDKYFNPKNYL